MKRLSVFFFFFFFFFLGKLGPVVETVVVHAAVAGGVAAAVRLLALGGGADGGVVARRLDLGQALVEELDVAGLLLGGHDGDGGHQLPLGGAVGRGEGHEVVAHLAGPEP
eukprot:NODE_3482_length_663_cov_215.022801_g2025_i7.p2 GENE.NODE_3482_length_663_cov_215.022801_g2025_i7~~NODE_3482_length_663_cov_215.022801_g2025_i7.p2  ORF type:complete len:110 (+),score=62.02 NODE_3482_length_663_cov_215.022801_g2025_i7:223-552(+)